MQFSTYTYNLLPTVKKRKTTPAPTLDRNPFSYIDKDKIHIDSNTELARTGTSWYSFMKTIGIVGFALTILVCAIIYGFTKSPEKKQELKERFLVKSLLFIGLFAFIFLIGQVYEISKVFIG